jgi:hypothetical protein
VSFGQFSKFECFFINLFAPFSQGGSADFFGIWYLNIVCHLFIGAGNFVDHGYNCVFDIQYFLYNISGT